MASGKISAADHGPVDNVAARKTKVVSGRGRELGWLLPYRRDEVVAGDDAIWLHRVTPEHELASPHSMTAQTGGLVVRVDDVDAHYEQARAAGAHIDQEPTDQPYGQREYGVRDPEGHRWWFATSLT